MELNYSEKNAISALEYVIHSHNLKVTSKTLKEQLYLHPDFPSLLSLSDVLRKWNIPNVATRIYYKELVNIPLPAIAFVESNSGILAPIRHVSESSIEWLDTQKGWQNESLEDFASKWGNVVLLLEPNENSEEKDFFKNRRIEILDSLRIPFIFIGICLAFVLLGHSFRNFFTDFGWEQVALITLKVIGVVISSLLIWQSVDSENEFIRSICGKDSKNDCNNILNSNAAKIFGWLKWSEVGLFYFGGGLILALFTLFDKFNTLIQYMILTNFIVLPYTIYSIYYQYFIAKTWCRLCLFVQLILWIEFVISVIILQKILFQLSFESLALVLFSFLIPMIFWAFIKKPIENKNIIMPLKRELQKAKFNTDYLVSVFEKQPTMPPIFSGMKTVKIGNLNSENTVTIVTNPMCGPCKKLHKEIENLIKQKGINLPFHFSFVFTGGKDALQVAQRIFSVSEIQQENAMQQWFSGKFNDVEEWFDKINVPNIGNNINEANEQVKVHQRWIEIAEIKSTPTIFLNGKELPLLYGLSDIENILDNTII